MVGTKYKTFTQTTLQQKKLREKKQHIYIFVQQQLWRFVCFVVFLGGQKVILPLGGGSR